MVLFPGGDAPYALIITPRYTIDPHSGGTQPRKKPRTPSCAHIVAATFHALPRVNPACTCIFDLIVSRGWPVIVCVAP